MATHEYTMPADYVSQERPLALSGIGDNKPVIHRRNKTRRPMLAFLHRFVVQPNATFLICSIVLIGIALLTIVISALAAEPSTANPSRVEMGPAVGLLIFALGIIGALIGSFIFTGYVCIPACAVVGGVVGGIFAGGRLQRAGIGPLLALHSSQGMTVQSDDHWMLHGTFPVMDSEKPQNFPRVYIGMLIGHAAGILVFGALTATSGLWLTVLILSRNAELWSSGLGAGFGQAGLFLALTLLLSFVTALSVIYAQFRIGNVRYVRILQAESAGSVVLKGMLSISRQSHRGVRPRDWQSDLLTTHLSDALGSIDGEPKATAIMRCLMAYRYAMDRGDHETAIQCLDTAHTVEESMSEWERRATSYVNMPLADEMAYVAAIHYGKPQHAQDWIAKLSEVTSYRWTRLRAEAAWLLVIGDAAGARERAEQGLALIREYLWLDPGMMTGETDQLEMLIKRARAAAAEVS